MIYRLNSCELEFIFQCHVRSASLFPPFMQSRLSILISRLRNRSVLDSVDQAEALIALLASAQTVEAVEMPSQAQANVSVVRHGFEEGISQDNGAEWLLLEQLRVFLLELNVENDMCRGEVHPKEHFRQ